MVQYKKEGVNLIMLDIFEKIIENFHSELNDLEDKIVELDEKSRMSKVNTIESKLINFCVYFIIGFAFANIIFIFLHPLFKITISTEVMLYLDGCMFVFAIFSGIILTIIFEKKYDIKNRFLAFSKAKNETEKLSDYVKYEIETKKVQLEKEVLSKTVSFMETTKNNFNSIFQNKKMQNEKEVENKILILKEELDVNKDKLHAFAAQSVLHEIFWKYRSKSQSLCIRIMFPIMLFMLLIIAFVVPYMMVGSMSETPETIPFVWFSPLLVISIIAAIYLNVRDKRYKRVFKEINATLGHYALPLEIKGEIYDEKVGIETRISDTIREISNNLWLYKVLCEEQQIDTETI